jgi:hypothetical protein
MGKIKKGLLGALQLYAAVCASTALAAGGIVEFRGGSNFAYFDLQNCSRNKFALLPNFEQNKDLINEHLQAMFKNGQRRLRTAIPLPGHPSVGTEGRILSSDLERNIVGLLAAIKNAGFQEIELVIGSVGAPPFSWDRWHENLYTTRWRYITELRPLLIASGLHYRIDLLNEGIPAGNQPMLKQYTQRLWLDYTRAFGKGDTIGFSVIAAPKQDRFAQMPQVYGQNPPNTFDLHVYDDPYGTVLNAHKRLSALGYSIIPWIIGESYYNDGEQADAIALAIQHTGQRVLFLLEWPLRKAKTCDDIDVVPFDFQAYIKRGF